MANVTFGELLHPASVAKLVSGIRAPRNRFSNLFGMTIGGPAENQVGDEQALVDQIDNTRTIAQVKPRGAGPPSSSPQAVQQRPVSFVRSRESIHIDQHRIWRGRVPGSDFYNAQVDRRGAKYVDRQQLHLAQKFQNYREYAIAQMCSVGAFDLLRSGDAWVPVASGSGDITVDFGIPAGNKSQLDMLGGGDIITASWKTSTTKILDNIDSVDDAMEELHGYRVTDIIHNSTLTQSILENDQVQATAGTSQAPFEFFRRAGEDGEFGTDQTYRLIARPYLTFHVINERLVVNGTETKMVPDDTVIFLCSPGDPMLYEYLVGSEIVVKSNRDDDQGEEVFGYETWTERCKEPAGWNLQGIDKGLPVPYIPKTIAIADITP